MRRTVPTCGMPCKRNVRVLSGCDVEADHAPYQGTEAVDEFSKTSGVDTVGCVSKRVDHVVTASRCGGDTDSTQAATKQGKMVGEGERRERSSLQVGALSLGWHALQVLAQALAGEQENRVPRMSTQLVEYEHDGIPVPPASVVPGQGFCSEQAWLLGGGEDRTPRILVPGEVHQAPQRLEQDGYCASVVHGARVDAAIWQAPEAVVMGTHDQARWTLTDLGDHVAGTPALLDTERHHELDDGTHGVGCDLWKILEQTASHGGKDLQHRETRDLATVQHELAGFDTIEHAEQRQSTAVSSGTELRKVVFEARLGGERGGGLPPAHQDVAAGGLRHHPRKLMTEPPGGAANMACGGGTLHGHTEVLQQCELVSAAERIDAAPRHGIEQRNLNGEGFDGHREGGGNPLEARAQIVDRALLSCAPGKTPLLLRMTHEVHMIEHALHVDLRVGTNKLDARCHVR